MTPTKKQIAKRLRTLANRMTDVATDMDYYGGFAEWALHGKELANAANIARQWADEIDAERLIRGADLGARSGDASITRAAALLPSN